MKSLIFLSLFFKTTLYIVFVSKISKISTQDLVLES